MPADGFTIKVENEAVDRALAHLHARLDDPTPVMRDIAELLRTETEENFLREGRPRWQPLSPVTVAERGRAHPILQRSGDLARHVELFYDRYRAGVSANLKYSAIHQFGGQAGVGRKVAIPARPYLPADVHGELQPGVELEVLDIIEGFLSK